VCSKITLLTDETTGGRRVAPIGGHPRRMNRTGLLTIGGQGFLGLGTYAQRREANPRGLGVAEDA